MDSNKKYKELKKKFRRVKKNCEVCGSAKNTIFQNYGRTSFPGKYGILTIVICKDCGHKYQNPNFSDNFFKEYYKELYREIAFDGKSPSSIYIDQQKQRGKKVYDWYSSLNKNFKGKMLDHGCASGFTMSEWEKKGWDCFGIDPHRPSVLLGKKHGFNIKISSGEDIKFKRESFDVVLSLGSLEHSYDVNKSLKRIHNILKDSGHLVVRWRSDKIFGSPLEYFNHNHYRFFSINCWKILLQKHGFKITVSSSKKVEGWESYDYFIAVKEPIKLNLSQNIKQNKLDYKKEIKKIHNKRKEYYISCKKIINNFDKKQPSEMVFRKFISKEKISWGFLGGNSKEVIKRSILEAKRYVVEYDNGKVI